MMMAEYNYNKTLKDIYPNIDFSKHEYIEEDNLETINKKILREYSNYDILSIIKEGLCLEVLVLFAVDLLEENAFEQGDMKPGDMLEGLIGIDGDFWSDHMSLKERLEETIKEQILFLENSLLRLNQ